MKFGKVPLEHITQQIKLFCSNNFQASQVILKVMKTPHNSITTVQEYITMQTRN